MAETIEELIRVALSTKGDYAMTNKTIEFAIVIYPGTGRVMQLVSNEKKIIFKDLLKTSDISIVRSVGFKNVKWQDGRPVMLVDENGHAKDLAINYLATYFYNPDMSTKILGTVVFMKEKFAEGGDLKPLQSDETAEVLDVLNGYRKNN